MITIANDANWLYWHHYTTKQGCRNLLDAHPNQWQECYNTPVDLLAKAKHYTNSDVIIILFGCCGITIVNGANRQLGLSCSTKQVCRDHLFAHLNGEEECYIIPVDLLVQAKHYTTSRAVAILFGSCMITIVNGANWQIVNGANWQNWVHCGTKQGCRNLLDAHSNEWQECYNTPVDLLAKAKHYTIIVML